MAMFRSPKQARDWYYANQGGIKPNHFVTIQYCLHAEAQRIRGSAALSVFLMRLWWGSSCTHHKPICSSTKSYRTCVVFQATFAPRLLGAAGHGKRYTRIHKITVIISLLKSCYRHIRDLNGIAKSIT